MTKNTGNKMFVTSIPEASQTDTIQIKSLFLGDHPFSCTYSATSQHTVRQTYILDTDVWKYDWLFTANFTNPCYTWHQRIKSAESTVFKKTSLIFPKSYLFSMRKGTCVPNWGVVPAVISQPVDMTALIKAISVWQECSLFENQHRVHLYISIGDCDAYK